jgi:hypothetical protein
MTTARDIMHTAATCVTEYETVTFVAHHMGELSAGAPPIWRDDDRLHETIPDRDIVLKCIAAGQHPDTTTATAGELAQGGTNNVDADASLEEMLNVMEEHQLRRPLILDTLASES